MQTQRPTCYRGFIVRFWKEQATDPQQDVARFTLEIPATGQRLGFLSLEVLLEALRREITLAHATDQEDPAGKEGSSWQ